MIRLAISVEGPTEEEFVNRLIAGHLRSRGIETRPVSLGGSVTVTRLAKEMVNLFWQRYDFVTSLVDFYGFRKKGERTPCQLERAVFVEADRLIGRSWDQRAVFPYIQQHEFEGLLFSDVDSFSTLGPDVVDDDCLATLHRIRNHFATPEDINDDQHTAPSKRILGLMPRYRKIAGASVVAEKIGLDVIRAECPRFHRWVTRLESLGTNGDWHLGQRGILSDTINSSGSVQAKVPS